MFLWTLDDMLRRGKYYCFEFKFEGMDTACSFCGCVMAYKKVSNSFGEMIVGPGYDPSKEGENE